MSKRKKPRFDIYDILMLLWISSPFVVACVASIINDNFLKIVALILLTAVVISFTSIIVD